MVAEGKSVDLAADGVMIPQHILEEFEVFRRVDIRREEIQGHFAGFGLDRCFFRDASC
jgi:hypothetical protein